MNPHQPRLFIAVPVAPYVKDALSELCERWKTGFPFHKWTHSDDYHITIKFLGETEPDAVQHIKRLAEDISARFAPFSLSVGGLGTFGPPSAPQILWAGVNGQLPVLHALQREIEQEMVRLRFPKEERAYRPHLTLARKYRGCVPFLRDSLRQLAVPDDCSPLTWTAQSIVLYESRPQRRPMYAPVAEFPLTRKGAAP